MYLFDYDYIREEEDRKTTREYESYINVTKDAYVPGVTCDFCGDFHRGAIFYLMAEGYIGKCKNCRRKMQVHIRDMYDNPIKWLI